jgi:hypothetical protein
VKDLDWVAIAGMGFTFVVTDEVQHSPDIGGSSDFVELSRFARVHNTFVSLGADFQNSFMHRSAVVRDTICGHTMLM